MGTASGVRNINGHSLITADSLVVQATGGVGGNGGNGGRTDDPAYENGGDGGDGGNAYAYGVQGSGGTTELAVDKIAVTAAGAAGGSGGTATGGGSDGAAGTISDEAKATAFMPSRTPLSTCMPKPITARSRSALRQIMRQAQKHMQCMPITQ